MRLRESHYDDHGVSLAVASILLCERRRQIALKNEDRSDAHCADSEYELALIHTQPLMHRHVCKICLARGL